MDLDEKLFFAGVFAACAASVAAVAWLLVENQGLIEGGLL